MRGRTQAVHDASASFSGAWLTRNFQATTRNRQRSEPLTTLADRSPKATRIDEPINAGSSSAFTRCSNKRDRNNEAAAAGTKPRGPMDAPGATDRDVEGSATLRRPCDHHPRRGSKSTGPIPCVCLPARLIGLDTLISTTKPARATTHRQLSPRGCRFPRSDKDMAGYLLSVEAVGLL